MKKTTKGNSQTQTSKKRRHSRAFYQVKKAQRETGSTHFCAGCSHLTDRTIASESGPSTCRHMDKPAFPKRRCHSYNSVGLPYPL